MTQEREEVEAEFRALGGGCKLFTQAELDTFSTERIRDAILFIEGIRSHSDERVRLENARR